MKYNIDRFVLAQKREFEIALKDIKNGKKIHDWIWFIFPQIKGLGHSAMSEFYAIENINEAKEYLDNKYIKNNMILICEELLKLNDNIKCIMGEPDNLKLKSSMTLFDIARPDIDVFKRVLDKFYSGEKDILTLKILLLNN